MTSELMIDRLYSAAFSLETWDQLIQDLADNLGAKGGIIFSADSHGQKRVVSPRIEGFVAAYEAGGHFDNNVRSAPLIGPADPWFKTDTDAVPERLMPAVPVYRDLLIPLGYQYGAGSVFQGSKDDMFVLTLEGFESNHSARSALSELDGLRPHIGRALTLATRMQSVRNAAIIRGMEIVGAEAAVFDSRGKVRGATEQFIKRFGDAMVDARSRMKFSESRLDNAVIKYLRSAPSVSARSSSAIIVDPTTNEPCVGHIIPLAGCNRDIFESDGFLLLIANRHNIAIADAGTLKLLFDLTPSEARLSMKLIEGHTLKSASLANGITYATARAHLRSIFQKTGTRRQGELLLLLAGTPGL